MKIKDIKINKHDQKLNTEYKNHDTYRIHYDDPIELISHHIEQIAGLIDHNNNFTPNQLKQVLYKCIDVYTKDMAKQTGGDNINFDGIISNRILNIDELEIELQK